MLARLLNLTSSQTDLPDEIPCTRYSILAEHRIFLEGFEGYPCVRCVNQENISEFRYSRSFGSVNSRTCEMLSGIIIYRLNWWNIRKKIIYLVDLFFFFLLQGFFIQSFFNDSVDYMDLMSIQQSLTFDIMPSHTHLKLIATGKSSMLRSISSCI